MVDLSPCLTENVRFETIHIGAENGVICSYPFGSNPIRYTMLSTRVVFLPAVLSIYCQFATLTRETTVDEPVLNEGPHARLMV
jgi:hypothetical protein